MNDRFKMRLYDNGEMYYIDDYYFFEERGIHSPDDLDIIVMQCTGLRDKNGKLIYEGDVVKVCDVSALGYVRERIGEVVYGYSFYPAFIIETTLGDVKDFTDDMEVIGNRYENPELLKECE